MTDASSAEPTLNYLLRPERVAQAIDRLWSQPIHQHFIAYLQLRRRSAIEHTKRGLEPRWMDLDIDLRVPGGPPNKPYLRPFSGRNEDKKMMWMNPNLAGSFAPSSIRERLGKVVTVDSYGRFSLPDDHAERALKHLLGGTRLDPVDLGAFFLRNRVFRCAGKPTTDDVIVGFRSEFHYRDPQDDSEFKTLYSPTRNLQELAWFTLESES